MENSEISGMIVELRKKLQQVAPNELLGAQLGGMIRLYAPELDWRSLADPNATDGALASFVESHLSEVFSRTAKHGLDWRYAKQFSPNAQPAAQDPATSLWKVFASPSSWMQICLDPTNWTLALFPTGPQASESYSVSIRPVQKAELQKIIEDFVEATPDTTLREQLRLKDGEPVVYAVWVEKLRAASEERYAEWHVIRRKGIEEVFAKRLSDSNVPEQEREQLVDLLRRSQQNSRVRIPPKAQFNQPASNSATPSELRRNFAACVDKLTDDQIRSVLIPFGIAVDILSRRHS
jgi:hypothetical protein